MMGVSSSILDGFLAAVGRLPSAFGEGTVTNVQGLSIEIDGLAADVCLGDHVRLVGRTNQVGAEVVGFRSDRAIALPFGSLEGLGRGARVESEPPASSIFPHPSWLGRCLDAFARPTDGAGPLASGVSGYSLRGEPIPAHARARIGGKLDLGVRSINTFLTCCAGQRLGVFAGSGVGKSTLLSMMARWTAADVSVIGLIGERGREAREFIEDSLGEEGMRRSVVVCATSDQPALIRRQAAYTAMATAEFFRDRGAQVLLLMDSVTRFAMAEREIGLAVGEPPTAKGYTPSVFAALPRLLERAGPGSQAGDGAGGSITGLFTVLVEGDDQNEPIADAVRSILDGHVVLDRVIAEQGRYPPVSILRSVSRAMPTCNLPEETEIVTRARRALATYEDMAELIRLGAYRTGSSSEVDEAIRLQPALEAFLSQRQDERAPLSGVYEQLARILDGPA